MGTELSVSGIDDIVGADEIISGVDDIAAGDDEVGRRRRGGAPKQRMQANRYMVLGLGSTAVLTTLAFFLANVPQDYFKTRRLVVTVTAAGILLTSLTTANKPEFAAQGNVPAEFFGATATDVTLAGHTASPGTTIRLDGTNPTAGTITVGAGVGGFVAQ